MSTANSARINSISANWPSFPRLGGSGRAALTFLLAASDAAGTLYLKLEAWLERAGQRRHLASLNDRALADIGRSRADAWQEASKPFWKA